MFSPVMDILLQYGGPVAAGILVALLFKAYFATQAQSKIREYQGDIVKSHEKILELEAENTKLERRLKEVEGSYAKDLIFMN